MRVSCLNPDIAVAISGIKVVFVFAKNRKSFGVFNFLVNIATMLTVIDENYMRLAIEKARQGIAAGQTPFGACIVTQEGQVVACAHNVVWQMKDITAHGEVTSIRAACALLNSVHLSGCMIYSTTEPCPMCFSAIHWARIGRIIFGASIEDASAAGFNELVISNEVMKRESRSDILVEGGCLRQECAGLFQKWKEFGQARGY